MDKISNEIFNLKIIIVFRFLKLCNEVTLYSNS